MFLSLFIEKYESDKMSFLPCFYVTLSDAHDLFKRFVETNK